MKISDFFIGSFGILRHVSGTFAPRLTVVWGQNESGKTTLLNFIRRALFYRKKYGDNFYDSVGETKVSGHLVLRMDGGQDLKLGFDGQRSFLGNVDGSSTTMLKEDFLPLKGEVFDRIFAIGLEDMQSLSRLGDAEIRNRFFAGESGEDSISFSDFLDEMEKTEKKLYIPGELSDCGAELNRLMAEIAVVELEIEELKAQNASYWVFLDELEKKDALFLETRGEIAEKVRRLGYLETISRIRPLWLKFKDVNGLLDVLGPPRAVPKEGSSRLNALLEKADDLRERLNEQKQKSDYEDLRRRQLENNPAISLLAHRHVLEELKKKIENGGDAAAEVLLLSAETAEKEDLLQRELMDFASFWSEENLLQADLSLNTERKAKSFQDALNDLEERRSELVRNIDLEEGRIGELQTETALIQEDLQKFEALSDNFQRRQDLFVEMRHGLLRNDALFREIRGEKKRKELLEEELRAESQPPVRRRAYLAKFLLILLLFSSGMTAALGYFEPQLHPYDFYGALICVAGALFPMGSILLSRKEHRIRTEHWVTRCERRIGVIDAIEAKTGEYRQEMQGIVALVEQISRDLNTRVPSTLEDLDAISEMMEEERIQIRRLEDRKNEEKHFVRTCQEHMQRREQTKADLRRVEHEAKEALEAWRAWLMENSFDSDLLPETFASFIERARAARKDLQSLNGLRSKADRCRGYIDSLDVQIRSFSEMTGLNLDMESMPAVFRSLEEGLELEARLSEIDETKRLLDFGCGRLERELAETADEVRLLCEEAGVDGESAFRSLIEEGERREVLEKQSEELRRQLSEQLGSDASGAVYERDFTGDAVSQNVEIEELRFAVAEDEKVLRGLQAECGTIRERISSLRLNDRLPRLRQKHEILCSRRSRLFRHWLSAILAGYFAEKARTHREKDRQPEIVRRAGEILALMVSRKWKIIADAGIDFSAVLERESDGVRLEEKQWSSGLGDQVYLSLRLAMALYWAERSEAIPIVLDDVFVRFDEARQREAMQALWDLSERVQIILLTCHRFTAEMFHSELVGKEGFAMIELSDDRKDLPRKVRSKKKDLRQRGR